MAQTTTLWRYPVARSTDPEELLHGLSRTFRLSRITPLGPLPQGRTHELRGVRASEFTIGLVTSPLAVRIGAGSGSSFFVNMVLSGALHAERDEERIVNSPSLAAVFNAGDPHVLRPEPDGADVLGLRLDRDLVERELAGLLGHPTEGPLRFDFALDLTTAATTGLRVAVDAILEQLDSEHEVLHHPAYTLGQVRSSEMVRLTVPTVAVLLGAGTGGGALALLPARRVVAAEHAWLAPLPPEGASAILHGTPALAAETARRQRVRSADLLADGVVHEIVPEFPPADEDPVAFCAAVATACARQLARQLPGELSLDAGDPAVSPGCGR